MTVNRRGLLALLGAGAGAAATPAKANTTTAYAYGHGVASGDPLQDRVVLWTRLTPLLGDPADRISGSVKIGKDQGAVTTVVKTVAVETGEDRDWTVKVDVTGLEPGEAYIYWFEFSVTGGKSPVGRTRTLPAGQTTDVVLAVASCALYPNGHFNAYGEIAKLDRVDAVIHLGDYIYEYGGAGSYGMESAVAAERPHDPPHEIVTLADYRRRHAQYKSDPQLQAAHARAPWMVVWDDHETANNSWRDGAENHDPDKGEGDWSARKAAALKAYCEWMPIREPAPGRTAEMANRAFQFGDIASLLMVETRLTARSEQLDYGRDLPIVDGKPDFAPFKAKWLDPDRRLIGPDQLAWLAGELKSSVGAGRTWQVIGNQIVMGRAAAPDFKAQLGEAKFAEVLAGLPEDYRRPVARLSALGSSGLPYNLDAWDGYPADRERVYGAFRAAGAHPLVLAGDSHAFWANELHDAGGARVAAEFGATGVTSPGAGDVIKGLPLDSGFMEKNPEVVFTDQAAKGFVLLTLTKDQAKAEMIAVSTILSEAYEAKALKTFTVTPTAGGGVSGLAEI
ncbi:MAG: alkaline phosphatase D family protein [Caulobacterales bacterium]|nr:alkaline phosphatase D family protein [Caulobacterales bacterium]